MRIGFPPVMGNVPTSLFASGTPQEMETAIDLCIERAAEGSGFILSSGCEIPLNATEDRIDHFFNTAAKPDANICFGYPNEGRIFSQAKDDEFAKSRKGCHCEHSEAISLFLTVETIRLPRHYAPRNDQ